MSKNVIEPIVALAAGDMSGNLASAAQVVKYMDNMAYQCSWTGSPAGTLNVQVSLDGTTWANVSPTGIDVAQGSPQFIDMNQTSASMIRCTFTASGGSTGTLKILASAKGI